MTNSKNLICSFIIACLHIAACTPADSPPGYEQSPSTQTPGDDDAIDLIIEGDYVVTMDDNDNVIADGAIAIDGGLIIAMGTADDINAQYTAGGHLPGDNRIVMPGLINGHSHAAMTLLRGIADDLSLLDWLTNYIFPAEVEFVDPEFVRIGTELACACWEMIRGGTTTFVDMYYYPDVIAQVVESCGLRAFVSATVIDQRSPDAEDAADHGVYRKLEGPE
jgi:5-methylthioadenosine/S-adenosylhomocysteine deaminase